MQFFPMLEALVTTTNRGELRHCTEYVSLLRERYDIRETTSDKVNLKFYTTDTLFDIDEEDLEGLTKAVHLRSGLTDSAMSLYKVLQATSQLIELDLQGLRWEEDEQDWDDSVPNVPSGLKKLCFENLKEVTIPIQSSYPSVLAQLVKIDGNQMLIAGTIPSLISFNVDSLKSLHVFLDEDRFFDQDVETMTKRLYQQNAMVETLILDCPGASNCPTGAQLHLNKSLELLNNSGGLDKGKKAGDVGEVEKASSDAVEELFLPRLVKLVIRNPVKLDGNLLRRVIETRSERNSSFKFEFIEGPYEDVVSFSDWETRG